MEDPNNLITNPPSCVVKLQGSRDVSLNGRLGIAVRYKADRDRYDVQLIEGFLFLTSVMVASRPQNLIKATNKSEIYKFRILQFLMRFNVLPLLASLLLTCVCMTFFGVYRGTIWAIIILLFISAFFWPGGSGSSVSGGFGNGGGSYPLRGFSRHPNNNDPNPYQNSNPQSNPWNWKRILAIVVGGLLLSRMGGLSSSSDPTKEILQALSVAYHAGYDHGSQGIPYVSLQHQFDANPPAPSEQGTLLALFRPPPLGEGNGGTDVFQSFKQSLELFYQFGHKDATEKRDREASLTQENLVKVLSATGLDKIIAVVQAGARASRGFTEDEMSTNY